MTIVTVEATTAVIEMTSAAIEVTGILANAYPVYELLDKSHSPRLFLFLFLCLINTIKYLP